MKNAAIYNALTRLLQYPTQRYKSDVNHCLHLLEGTSSEATTSLMHFVAYTLEQTTSSLEEAFAHTFDFNPDCSLELGWHLYGENYERGNFLVKMRGFLRQYNLPESAELPDHLSHILAVLGKMDDKEANELAAYYVIPGVKKLVNGMSKKSTPFKSLIDSIQCLLKENHALIAGVTNNEH